MGEIWGEYARIFTTLFAVADPIGAVPLYLAFTRNIEPKRNETARVAATAMGAMLIVSVLAGEPLLRFFGISADAFRIAGGMLFLLMALDMLQARQGRTKHTPKEDAEAAVSESVAIVPLAFPLLAGPGAISATIFYGSALPAGGQKVMLCAICAALAVAAWGVMRAAPYLERKLSQTALNASTRIMGLLLAAMAIEFIAGGLKNLLPGLAK